MNFAGPVLLLVGPLLASLLAFLLRRWQRAAVITGSGAVWLLWAMLRSIPLQAAGDTPLPLARSLTLTPGIQALCLFLYGGLTILFLLTLAFPQGRNFVPGTLAALSPLAGVLMIQPFAFGILLLLVAAALLAVVIQANQAGSTRAALRYLIMVVLAAPLFLVAGWMLATEQGVLLLPAARLLLIGFVILLAGFPFHIWVRSVVTDAPALVSVLIFGLVHLVVITFIFTLLSANAWVQQDAQFLQTVRWIGVATALLGGMLAVTALDFGRLLASLLLIDVAMTLLTLTIAGAAGWQTAVSVQISRFFSLLLAAMGLDLLRRHGETTAFAANRGLAGRAPLTVALFTFGCASLLGLPLTPGFGSRWAAIQQVTLAQQTPPIAWLPFLLLLATAGGVYGLLRCLARLLDRTNREASVAAVELPWLRGIAAVVVVVSLWLAAFPQTLLAYAYRLAGLFG